MKRITRRTIGVCVGVALGWYVAGLAPTFMPGLRVSMAEESSHHAAPVAATQPSSSESRESVTQEPAAHKEGEHEINGPEAAQQLVPGDRVQETPWFWPVVCSAAGLFVAAVAIGIPSLMLRGPLPPDPADTAHDDHDGHDDHGHDDHGNAGHH